ncbi:MAG: DUF192 domain-containing protein [Acidimicrobiia bacterium]
MKRLLLLLPLAVACSTPATPLPSTTAAIETGDLTAPAVRSVMIDGRTLDVAVASTPTDRSQGLQGVSDLGDLDGMLFEWGGGTVSSRFTMDNTLIPLDIFFFDANGRFVDGFAMVPCESDPCPSYAAALPYAYAIEVPVGSQPTVGVGSVLSISG